MRIAVLGAGGLGCVIGGYLAHTGQQVTLIGRQANMDAIRKDGLRITGPRGDFCIRDNLECVTEPDQAEGHFDYLMLCVKSKDSAAVMASSAELVKRCDTVFTLQNGINKEAGMFAWAGEEKVIGSSTMEGATLMAPGECINPFTGPVTAYFGEYDGTITPRVEAITEAFNKADLNSRAVDCIAQVLWEKMMQIGVASSWSVSTLGGGDFYFFDGITVYEGAQSYVQIALELMEVYKAKGYEIQDFYAPMTQFKDFEKGTLEEGTQLMMKWGNELKAADMKSRTSMHVDLTRGKKMEVDEIIKPWLDEATRLGIETPTVVAAYRIMKVLNHYLD
ncbi:MAG: 2-dehydropantoate 2-reductase [Immundisolibacteraceae bacterium]|jgi:2-dehydropantoate 2-reductase|nr:2-dehydropantoate 2-reductase [Immundisolibacteraceae bacterium]